MKYSQIKKLSLETGLKPTEIDLEDFLICDEEEADERTREYILDSVWAFRSSFLQAHMPPSISLESIEKIQELYEDANEVLIAMIDDLEHFIEDAVSADGRGHFLSSYDGVEIELGDGLYAFRIN